jgi:hypothetical protein
MDNINLQGGTIGNAQPRGGVRGLFQGLRNLVIRPEQMRQIRLALEHDNPNVVNYFRRYTPQESSVLNPEQMSTIGRGA